MFASLRRLRWQVLALCAVGIVVGAIVRLGYGSPWNTVVVAGGASGLAANLILSAWRELRREQAALQANGRRALETWRKLTHSGPATGALRKVGFAISIGWFVVVQATGFPTGQVLLWLSVALLAFSAALGLGALAGQLLKLAWSPVAGKALSLTAGAALVAVSLAVAKHITHALVHVDARFLPDFTNVMAAAILPWLGLLLATAIVMAYAVGQFIALFLTALASRVSRSVADVVAVFRKRGAVGGRNTARHEILVDRYMGVFGTMALALVLAEGAEVLRMLPTRMKPELTWLAVTMEYRTGGSCAGLEELPVVYLDNSQVSVARLDSGTYTFSVQPCILTPPSS